MIRDLLAAGIPEDLHAVATEHQAGRAVDSQRLLDAEGGLWPGTIVVGSRPRTRAARTVLSHCRPGETPWLILGSLGEGVLAAFDDRLLLVKTGVLTSFGAGSLGGGRVTTFPFHDITGIEYNSGLLAGVLEILTPSYDGSANKDFWRGTTQPRNADSNDPHTLSNTLPLDRMEHKQALPHLNELRHRISESKRMQVTVAQAQPAGGLAEELTKIAALRDSGVLTDDEFRAAKQRLIER